MGQVAVTSNQKHQNFMSFRSSDITKSYSLLEAVLL